LTIPVNPRQLDVSARWLKKRGALVTYSDPYIRKVRVADGEVESTDEQTMRGQADWRRHHHGPRQVRLRCAGARSPPDRGHPQRAQNFKSAKIVRL